MQKFAPVPHIKYIVDQASFLKFNIKIFFLLNDYEINKIIRKEKRKKKKNI